MGKKDQLLRAINGGSQNAGSSSGNSGSWQPSGNGQTKKEALLEAMTAQQPAQIENVYTPAEWAAMQAARNQQWRDDNSLSVGQAIGGGVVSGLWQNATGLANAAAASAAGKVASDDAGRLFGTNRWARGVDLMKEYANTLKGIWGDYSPGDGTLGQNLKDTAFSTLHYANQQAKEGGVRNEAVYQAANAAAGLVRNILPSLTGSNDIDENARWFADQAYGLTDKATDAVSKWGPMKYADNEQFQKALQNSGKAAQTAGQVSSVVANMLPSIATSLITKDPQTGLLAMAGSAAGNYASEAYRAGATPEQAAYIGLEKGEIEYATERMFDAVGAFGGGKLSKGLQQALGDLALTKAGRAAGKISDLALTKAGRAASKVGEFLGENVEEAAADWAGTGIERAVSGQTLNNLQRTQAGLEAEDDDVTILQALRGQLPWTEDGVVTLLSTLIMGGAGSLIRNNVVTVPKEQAEEVLKIARGTGNTQLVELADEYNKALERRGKLSIDQYQTIYEATERRVGEDEFRTQLENAGKERQKTFDRQMLSDWIDQRFADEGLNEDQIRVLKEGYETGEAGAADYAEGVANAFNYGKQRLTLEQARKSAEKSGSRLNDVQFEHAYRLGLGTVTETADTQTEEGRTKVLANLRALGTQAEAAAEAYDTAQDVKMYASAMGKAIQAYAANGADLKAIWQAAKDGQTGNEIQYLTEAQIETAQRLGAEFREEQIQLAEKKDAKFAADRQQAQDAIRQAGSGTNTAGISAAILKIQDNITALQEEIRGTEEGLTLARQAQPGIENTTEYQESEARLQEHRKELQGYQELLKRANQLSAKAAKKTTGRKKGKVVYADKAGTAFGASYSAVDRSKLSETQKATARIAESIAEATGLEIRIVSFDNVETTDEKGHKFYRKTGGEYIRGSGGVMYINIDMSQNGKNMAAGSMFHELTHWLQEYAPTRYEELKRFVLQEMQKNPEAYEDIFNARRGTEGYSKISPDKVTDEMVANACMRVFEDADAVKRLVTQHRKLGERIRDFFIRLVEDIKAAFSEIDFSENFTLYREAQAVEGAMEEIRDLWISAFEEATENLQAQKTVDASKNTAAEGSGVQYQAAEREEILHLQDQIRENMWRFEGKPALATVNSEIAFNENNIGEAVSWIAEKIGAPVTIQRKGFGQVTFTKKRINQGFNYMPGKKGSKGRNAIGQALTTACVAAPEVVMNGDQIGHHSDHKGTGVQTWTFAGPVEIDGERGIMAVVVRKTNQNYYKVHRILTPSGDIMVLDNNKAEVSGGGSPENRTLAQPKLSAENSIADAEEAVNTETEQAQAQRVQYSVFEEDPETLKWLDKQEKDGDVVHTYKSFLEIDGKLYPPMASMKKGPDGKWKMTKAMEVGRWEKSVGDPSKIEVDPKNGRGYFTLKKDDGSTVKAAYNPYQHSSNLMINDQFTGAYSRPGLVTYECIIPKSELTSGYRAEHAKDAVGVHSWKAGPVAGKLIKAKGTERQVYLSRWLKPVRKVPDAEVAQHYKELLDGTDIAVPSNVVPPSLLHALEDAGVKIEYDPRAPKAQFQRFDSTGAELTEDQEKFFADSKIRDDQGRLKVMYRGGNGDFTVFDRKKSSYSNLYGRGFYFTDSKSHAEQYGKARAFYLNIQNPVQEGTHDITRAQLRKFLQEVGENEDYGLENYGYGATVDSVMRSLRGKDDFGILQDVNATAIGDFVAAVELFNEVNGTSFDGIIAPTETVAFRPEQIKNTDNKTPTSDPDVRFQMISEVEESDKLIAVHNKTMSGLRRMIERGGVPFPSIAIKKAGSGHNHYGPVSIVFGRSRIDPEVNRANRIYGGDAWTPTEPSLDYDVDSDKAYKIREKIKTLIGPGPYNSLRLSGTLDADEIAKKLKDNGGDIFEALKSNVGLKYAYMRIMGTEPELPTREKPLDGFFKYKNNQLVELFDQLGEERIQKADYSDEEFRQAVADILNTLQREELVAKMKERQKNGESTVSIERILNAYDKRPLYSRGDINVGVIQGALREYISDGRKLTQETDRSALEGILRDNTEVEQDPKYRKYIETTFQGVVRGSGIRNDKDVFTPSGNRRSFKQLHVPGTLDNIANVMSKMPETGGTAFGGSTLMGVGVKNYRTVEEARADRGRLYDGDYIDEEEFEGPKKVLNDRLQELVEAAAKVTSRDYAWEQRDSAREILLEAVRDSKTKAAMDRKLRSEAQWINYDPTLTDELWQLAEDTRNMKVPYFEAKLRRVVYPEEALAYIVEDTAEETDADLLKKMRDQGLNVLTYKAGDKEDRLRVLNSVEGAQFQRWDEPGAEVIRTVVEDAHPWPGNFPPVMYSTNLRGLNREGKALHEQAKNGDAEAARRIVARSVKPEKLSAFAKQYRGARLVAVRSEDGKNKIPYAYAAELAKYGLGIDDSIVQVAKAWHTGSNGIIRMIEHAGFDGDVKPGQEYILVDDVLTFGGTLNDLRMYIESKGGKVVACTTLAVGRNGHHLAIRPELVQQIYDKHGENIDTVLREEGIAYDVSSLTDRQGRYIRDLDVDTLRDRGAQERASEEYRGGKETGSREAKELTRTGSRPDAVLYQQYDDTYQDTEAESNERALAYTRLQNENAMFVDIIDKMSAVVKGKDKTIEKILKKLARSRRSDAERLAKQLTKEYGSKADLGEVAAAIKEVGDYFVQTPTESLNPEQAKELARKAAGLIAANAEDVLEETRDEVYGTIRDSIKGRKLSIRPEYAGELDQYGGYNAFKKQNAGNFTLTRADRVKNADEFVSVDQFYQDLNRTYGEAYFPEAGSDNGPVNEGEMVKIIADAFEAGEPIVVNPFEAYMGEATEMIANAIAFRVLNDNVLKPLLPAEAEKAFDQLKAATGENAELRKELDRATTRGEVMKEELERLQKEGRLSKKELVELRDEVYELTNALKKADQEYTALQEQAEQRLQQVKEEGRARVTEVKARERERAAKQIDELKKHYQELQKKARERREESAGTKKYREQVKRKAASLYEMLARNDDKHHVPEVLKRPVAEFLESLDFTSKRALRGGDETKADLKFGERLRELERMLSGQQSYIDGSSNVQADLGGYVDISEENMDYLRTCIEMVDQALKMGREFTINSMNAQQLKQLSNFLSNMNTAIRNLNHFMANARFESIREAAGQDIEQMKKLGNVSDRETGKASGFLMWENGTPYYVFRRFGKGGESIFDGFARGWEKMAFRAQEIMAFTENLYTDKEVRDWKTKVHEFTLSDGSKMKITTAQIMELSMLLNREQALKHIEAGGIQIGDIETKKGTKINTAQYHLTMEDILQITGALDARQRKVAKALQEYMARKGAEWGNEISMRRFGYNFYTEGENYYPIKTVPTDRPMSDQDLPQNASMFRLLNLSSSKSLNPHANNALVVGNIFDTFADHMSDMAKLNGMGLPILDAIKYFNYKEKLPGEGKTFTTETMQATIKQAYGPKALSYFRKLMQDINGTTESGDRGDPGFGKLLSNYKIAAVGANLRVALLQPTSYVRATAVLKPQYMVGIVPSRAAYQEAVKYSGTAVWKSLGYYDTDIARGMRGQIQHDDTWKDKVAEASMKAAELGDQLTWSMLWTACKRQAKGENSNLRGQALMDRTADLFRETVYASQVMDSTLTRSEIMRGKTHFTKAASAFMAEPTLSYNILLDAYSQFRTDERKSGRGAAWQKNGGKIGKAFAVYVSSAAFAAIVESLVDAMRDDDDDEAVDKFLQAFLGEDALSSEAGMLQRLKSVWLNGNLGQDLTIIGKLPFVKDIMSILQGYGASSMATDGIESVMKAIDILKGNGSKRLTPWGKIYKYLQPISQLSGLAISNLSRDAVAIWNATAGTINPEMKLRKYDAIAFTDEMQAGYDEYVKSTGISKAQFQRILSAANTDGNTSVKQDEMGAWLVDALAANEITEEQAQALWKSQWHSEKSKTFDKWRGTEPTSTTTSTAKIASTTKSTGTTSSTAAKKSSQPSGQIDGWDDFKTAAPIYGGPKREATYNAKPATMSLTEYTKMLQAADTDGNKSLKQDELGYALRTAVQNGTMSWDAAVAVWAAQGWSHDLSWWAAKHP